MIFGMICPEISICTPEGATKGKNVIETKYDWARPPDLRLAIFPDDARPAPDLQLQLQGGNYTYGH